jgi:pyruvate carboxylase
MAGSSLRSRLRVDAIASARQIGCSRAEPVEFLVDADGNHVFSGAALQYRITTEDSANSKSHDSAVHSWHEPSQHWLESWS